LLLVPSACGGYSEYFLGSALLDLFKRKEAGEIVTDNLIGFVTFDPFSTCVPSDN
jgi:hypothetical protein